MKVIKVGIGNISTDANGYSQLVNFYHEAKRHSKELIALDFYEITWFDGNMAALLASIIYKLNKENGLTFSTDIKYIKQKFDVLIRNGFLLFGDPSDDRKTVMPIKSFQKSDSLGFIAYIETNLMQHRGMPTLSPQQQEQIKDDLVELLSNIDYHSNTTDPFFVCGQYYPEMEYMVFTMLDLGDGFLPKIQTATNGKVSTSENAILWALRGQTTKPVHENVPGGLGIRNIHNYCKQNGGKLHIVTGNTFWRSDWACQTSTGCSHLQNSFMGSMINLFFKHS